MRLSYRTGVGIHEEKRRQMLAARDEIRLRRLARETREAIPRRDLAAFVRKTRATLDSFEVRERVPSVAQVLTRWRGTAPRHQ